MLLLNAAEKENTLQLETDQKRSNLYAVYLSEGSQNLMVKSVACLDTEKIVSKTKTKAYCNNYILQNKKRRLCD